jgi:Na+-translocating ferredoxin:NAD+ oxidoreductase subunit C
MRRLTFSSGGIHPPTEKELASSGDYTPLKAPPELVIPMAQHLGAPAVAVVKKKQALAAGDVVGEPAGFVSTFIHTPLAGKVKTLDKMAIGPAITPVVTVIPDEGAPLWEMDRDPLPFDPGMFTPREAVDGIKSAGIVGMGGAAFPTQVKLSPPKDAPIDVVILNGAECEPYLTADDCLMRNHSALVVEGARAVLHAVGASRCYVGIEDNKPQALEIMARTAAAYEDIDVVPLRTLYPQGSEKQLIEACTGRRVAPGKLPFSVGALVQNVGTTAAIYEALMQDRPLARRLVTVSGRAVKRPGNVLAPVGASVLDLIEHCGGFVGEVAAVVMGGPMMGRTTTDLQTPITKGTSGILALSPDELPRLAEDPCLRCGRCVVVCPMDLVPVHLEKLIAHGRIEEAVDAMDCVECGCCAYTCPAHRRLVHRFRLAKWEIGRQRRREQAKQKAAG